MKTAPISHASGKNQRTTQLDLGSRRDTAGGEGKEKHTQPEPDAPKFKTKTNEKGERPAYGKAFFMNLPRLTPPAADGATSAVVASQTPLSAGAASLPHWAPRRASPAGSPSLIHPSPCEEGGRRQPREWMRLRSGTALSLARNKHGVNCSRVEKIAIVSSQRRAAV